jgi:hypothetical protein
LQPPGASGEDNGEFEVVEEEEDDASADSHDEWDVTAKDVESVVGVRPHPHTISLVLEPKNYYPTVIKFTPKDSQVKIGKLLI